MQVYFEHSASDHEIGLSQLTIDIYNNLRNGLPDVVVAPKPTIEGDWRLIASMRWCMRSDGAVDRIESLRARISQEGSALALRAALERRSQHLLQICPALSKNAAWQITAMGPAILNVILDTVDMLEFFEKELQPIDLCELLA
jgi:hypothetical protein